MFVISKKYTTLKPQKAKVHYIPYKTSKLKVFFNWGLKLNLFCQIASRGFRLRALASLVLEFFA